MSENESPVAVFNKCAGVKIKQWREEQHLSLSDIVELLQSVIKMQIDSQMLADWESGKEELPGYLFCFFQRLHRESFAQFSSVEPGTVMAQKEVILDGVLEGMRQFIDEN